MALSENIQEQALEFAMSLTRTRCEMIVAHWLSHYVVYSPPIPELSMDQNEIAAFAVGAMIERLETE